MSFRLYFGVGGSGTVFAACLSERFCDTVSRSVSVHSRYVTAREICGQIFLLRAFRVALFAEPFDVSGKCSRRINRIIKFRLRGEQIDGKEAIGDLGECSGTAVHWVKSRERMIDGMSNASGKLL